MGIILGFLCLICFWLLIAKAWTHRLHLKKADSVLMRIHKPACIAFLVICILHILLVIPVIKTRHFYVLITGLSTAMAMFLLIISYHIMKQNHDRRLCLHRVLSVILLFCIIFHISIYYVDYRNYQIKIKEIQIEEVDISNINNGIYVGEYDAGYIYAKVKVTVRNKQILNIDILEHDNERGTRAETMVDKIIHRQKINVDAISGATNSSLVIKKAVENALKQETGRTIQAHRRTTAPAQTEGLSTLPRWAGGKYSS